METPKSRALKFRTPKCFRGCVLVALTMTCVLHIDLYRLAVHLHYWTLVLGGLGLLTGLFNSAEIFLRLHHLPVRCGKPTLVLLVTACRFQDILTGLQTDRQTNRQADTQTDRQTERLTG